MRVIIRTGSIYELLDYEKTIFGKGGYKEVSDLEQRERNYQNQVKKRRDNVRRLACANFTKDNCKFLTLTFKENITDIKKCNNEFKNFIKRLKYSYKINDLKYLAVIEFQKRGAIHYHCILNIPFIPQEELLKLWKNGLIWINRIDNVDNVGAYLVKYMTKDNADERLMGEMGYLHSRNLKKPIVITDTKDIELFNTHLLLAKKVIKNSCPEYEATFDTPLGKCHYQQFNLDRPV